MSCGNLEAVVGRLEAVATKLETIALKGKSDDGECVFIAPLETLIKQNVNKFVEISTKIGPDVGECGKLLLKGFTSTLDIMKVVSVTKKPSNDKVLEIFKPLSACVEEIKAFVSKNFKSQFKAHLEAISAFSVAFGWVLATGKTHAFITENIESGMFYANRILTGFKDKGEDHKVFVQTLKKCFEELQEYTKEYHSMGCSWNPKGGSDAPVAKPATSQAPASATPSAAAAPGGQKPTMGNLFSEINKGTGITGGLRKVDDSQKTHKNPALRAGAVVAETDKPKSTSSSKPDSKTNVDKPPVLELQGKKWMIEYQKDQQLIDIKEGDIGYSIFVHKCVNTNIMVHQKVNIVTLDNCINCKVQLVNGVISSVEVTNCKKAEVHGDNVLPFVNINSTDGCQIYLNDKSKDARVSTSVSSSVNICVWSPTSELVEHPVPHLFVSYFKDKKLITEVSECI